MNSNSLNLRVDHEQVVDLLKYALVKAKENAIDTSEQICRTEIAAYVIRLSEDFPALSICEKWYGTTDDFCGFDQWDTAQLKSCVEDLFANRTAIKALKTSDVELWFPEVRPALENELPRSISIDNRFLWLSTKERLAEYLALDEHYAFVELLDEPHRGSKAAKGKGRSLSPPKKIRQSGVTSVKWYYICRDLCQETDEKWARVSEQVCSRCFASGVACLVEDECDYSGCFTCMVGDVPCCLKLSLLSDSRLEGSVVSSSSDSPDQWLSPDPTHVSDSEDEQKYDCYINDVITKHVSPGSAAEVVAKIIQADIGGAKDKGLIGSRSYPIILEDGP
ncbi:hypothetical protein PVAG01_09393 [Phlyctema vagabunda]|uniref:Uncharacterized protein n=1 Tax=Phlyctema vagabunda TaxID=108571 RepID=A0ABR4P784_9HELO